ncbi:hypothetical protein [Falsiroseomonas tokyonensis]|uniref:Uncharacterized protein n=1 Tax=Falsiroseomonas tokyonensis TaxID=430521 RepID=A0ABV7BN05_9PROT|nr:hypothetical protein [Falsiroseomonas tokyonensis]MBU8536586.1 hypothetical protein [Falsiroseomonas tokyonensis]
MQVVGFSPMLNAIAGLIVWAAHFLLVYGAQATVCWRGLAGATLWGQPLVPAIVLGLTALGLVAVALIGGRAWRRLHSGLASQEGEEQSQFTLWMSLAVTLMAALAMVWEAVPVLILPPCG